MATESTPQEVKKRRARRRVQSNEVMQNQIDVLTKRLEAYIAGTFARKEEVDKEVPISNFMAANVGVVGLKEALTLNHKPLKIVWIILLLAGIAATIFYIVTNTYEFLNKEPSTKIWLERSKTYDFPHLVLCPPWFFDIDEVPKNLSPDAIRYSLAYASLFSTYFSFDNLNSFSPNASIFYKETILSGDMAEIFSNASANLKHGQLAFHTFYESKNYTSLADYFRDLATNISASNATLTLDRCTKCNMRTSFNKYLFANAICYDFDLNKATPMSDDDPIHIKLTNTEKTGGVLSRANKTWLMGFMSNMSPTGPSTKLLPYSTYNIKLGAHRMISLVNSSNCADTIKNTTYDQRLCTEICIANKTYTMPMPGYTSSGYTSFVPTNDLSKIYNAAEYCMSQIDVSLSNWRDKSINASSNQLNKTGKDMGVAYAQQDEALIDCYRRCLPPCDRIIYDITLDHSPMDQNPEDNKSVIELYIRHSAVFQGGIVVWQEVTTTTFSEFISSVGGTLGLFLGCTFLTLAQLLLSFVNYCLDQRAVKTRHGAIHNGPFKNAIF